MYAGEFHDSVFAHFRCVCARELNLDASAEAQRLVVLRELVVFGAVGIKVVFSVPLCYLGNFAAKHQSHHYGLFDSVAVYHRQHSGKRPHDGVGKRVRRFAETVSDRREHFAFCLNLDVYFESYYGFVFHKIPFRVLDGAMPIRGLPRTMRRKKASCARRMPFLSFAARREAPHPRIRTARICREAPRGLR